MRLHGKFIDKLRIVYNVHYEQKNIAFVLRGKGDIDKSTATRFCVLLLFSVKYTTHKEIQIMTGQKTGQVGQVTLDTYVTTAELQKALNLSRTSIYQLSKQGQMPQGVRIGRSRRWAVSEIRAWLDQQKGETA